MTSCEALLYNSALGLCPGVMIGCCVECSYDMIWQDATMKSLIERLVAEHRVCIEIVDTIYLCQTHFQTVKKFMTVECL